MDNRENLKNSGHYLETEIYYFKKIINKNRNFLIKSIIFLKKKFVFITTFTLFGGMFGYVFFLIFNYSIYETKLIVKSEVVSSDLIVDIVNNFGSCCDNNSEICIEKYSKNFNISKERASKIIKIDAIEMQKIDSASRTNISAERVMITIQVKDSSIYKNIENGIINFINENDYIKKQQTIISTKLSKIENALHQDTTVLLKSGNSLIKPVLDAEQAIKEYNTWAKNNLFFKISLIDSTEVHKNAFNLNYIIVCFLKFSFVLSFLVLFIVHIIKSPLYKPD